MGAVFPQPSLGVMTEPPLPALPALPLLPPPPLVPALAPPAPAEEPPLPAVLAVPPPPLGAPALPAAAVDPPTAPAVPAMAGGEPAEPALPAVLPPAPGSEAEHAASAVSQAATNRFEERERIRFAFPVTTVEIDNVSEVGRIALCVAGLVQHDQKISSLGGDGLDGFQLSDQECQRTAHQSAVFFGLIVEILLRDAQYDRVR